MPERANPRRRKKGAKAEGPSLKHGNGSSKRSEASDESSVEHEFCATNQPEVSTSSVRLGRSNSEPIKESIASADFERKALSDGEADDKDSAFGQLSLASGTSSQSSDSGFSQDSQECELISSQTAEIVVDCAIGSAHEQKVVSDGAVSDKDTAYGPLPQAPGSSQSSDSGCFSQDSPEQADSLSSQATESVADSDAADEGIDDDDDAAVRPMVLKERPKELILDSNRKRKMSADDFDDSIFRSKRRDELPSTLQNQKNVYSLTSVMLTPDTDANTPSTSSSSSVTSTPSFICTMCCVRPKDACFIHGQISHQVCCYQCAKMIFKNKGTCPVCRRRIEKITRNIVI